MSNQRRSEPTDSPSFSRQSAPAPTFAGHRYQIARAEVQAGMRRQRVRVELRLDGELKARYQGRYLAIAECGIRTIAVAQTGSKSVRKDHNAGGRSNWMDGFFDRPSPPLWKAIGDGEVKN